MINKTDEGQEHELVLGNKQLLSAFFIVVVLLGVFFTMGYIIGRNTSTPTTVTADGAPGTVKPVDAQAEKALQGMSPEAPGASGPEAMALPPPNPPSPEVLTQEKPYEDAPPAHATTKITPKKPEVTARVAPPVEKPKAVERIEKPAPDKASASLDARKYLQVMAVKRPDAEKMQKILNGQGFPATLRESSKEGLYRVLVGPYGDRPSLSKAKDDLKGAGFDAIVAR